MVLASPLALFVFQPMAAAWAGIGLGRHRAGIGLGPKINLDKIKYFWVSLI